MLNVQRVQQFERYVSEFMAEHQLPGVAIAIAAGETVIYSRGFGWRDRDRRLPVTADTVFGVASLTKSFTALAIAQLVEQGLLVYDQPVQQYLPAFTVKGYPAEAVSIRHLLTHTSGLAPLPTLFYSIRQHTPSAKMAGEQSAGGDPEPPIAKAQDLLDYLRSGEYDTLGPAGAYYSYSNDCYALLGSIIEQVSGQAYPEYVQQHILDPLQMNRSTFRLADLTGRLSDDVTALYYRQDGQVLQAAAWQEAPPYLACGWLRSSASDMIKYYASYVHGLSAADGQLLSPDGLRQMWANPFRYSLCAAYAHGLRVQQYAGATLVCHSGGLQGVASYGGFVPERGLSAVVLCNLSGVPVAKLWAAAINLGLGLPLEQPLCAYQPTAWPAGQDLANYCGRFRSAEGADLTVSASADGGLSLQGEDESSAISRLTDEVGLCQINEQDTEVRWFFPAEGGPAWAVSCGGRMILRDK